MAQEEIWAREEADAWFRRAGDDWLRPASIDDPVLIGLNAVELPEQGTILDLGGATGRIAAGFLRDHPTWRAHVMDLSKDAIIAGKRAFPNVHFINGSITNFDFPCAGYDVVVICAVLHFLERRLLSSAVANSDLALADGGFLVLHDFDPPHRRANHYSHNPGLFTYKQDYASCYLALGIYHLEYRRSWVKGSAANPSDPYDRRWMTAVLRKDLQGGYVRTV